MVDDVEWVIIHGMTASLPSLTAVSTCMGLPSMSGMRTGKGPRLAMWSARLRALGNFPAKDVCDVHDGVGSVADNVCGQVEQCGLSALCCAVKDGAGIATGGAQLRLSRCRGGHG